MRHLKNILALAFFIAVAPGCSLLNKIAGKTDKSSRTVAGLGGYSQTSQSSQQMAQSQKKAVLRKIKQGKAVLSKAIVLNEKGKPVCGIDLKNRQDLVPGFAKAAPAGFRSAVNFKKSLPSCREDLKRKISYKVSQRGFALEGTQTALAPLAVFFAATGLIGCGVEIVGAAEEWINDQKNHWDWESSAIEGLKSAGLGFLAGAAAEALVFSNIDNTIYYSNSRISEGRREHKAKRAGWRGYEKIGRAGTIAASAGTSAGIMGVAGAVAGFLTCNAIVYVTEAMIRANTREAKKE